MVKHNFESETAKENVPITEAGVSKSYKFVVLFKNIIIYNYILVI